MLSSDLQIHTCSTQIIKTKITPGLHLTGDKFALTSVVTNLIENAVKYNDKDEKKIDVFSEENKEGW